MNKNIIDSFDENKKKCEVCKNYKNKFFVNETQVWKAVAIHGINPENFIKKNINDNVFICQQCRISAEEIHCKNLLERGWRKNEQS